MGLNANQLPKNQANYQALSPISFLTRTARVHPDRLALVHGPIRQTWRETHERCARLASALANFGVSPGQTVAIMAPNTPAHYEAHFGVPMAGAILNSINTRLDAKTVRFILEHGNAQVFLVDREFAPVAKQALEGMDNAPRIISIDDPIYQEGEMLSELDYESFLAGGDPEFEGVPVADEWDAISLNYTSGTTGDPKGVVYHHRGAYLNATANAVSWAMGQHPTYLWTLPMFHCNGWCFPWTMALVAGTSVCLRHVRADHILQLISQESVDHLCGAPIVLNLIAGAPAEQREQVTHAVKVMTAGAPPPASTIEAMEAMRFSVTHVYGLTETYGPCVVCEWSTDWAELSMAEQAKLKARQGVPVPMQEDLIVAHPETLQRVPQDGQTLGEIFARGNIVMKGYANNPKANEECFQGGWFRTGDLGVWHADSYVEIKDRSKDIIISGGENISSIEVEEVLFRHPLIQDAAVVAVADEKWGEVPCAFVTLVPDAELSAAEVIEYCQDNMARFKAPKHVMFQVLPRTSTGKVQKFALREIANASIVKGAAS